MEFKLYRCNHCGNIAFKVVNSGVPMVCCGEKMQEMSANVTEASLEKHIPVISVNEGIATVSVGSVIHPMLDEHYIQFIGVKNENTVAFKMLKPGDVPVMNLLAEGSVEAYELCNIHGFWKGETK